MEKQDVCNDPKTKVAPPILNFLGNGDSFKKMTEVQDNCMEVNDYYNYILRCTDGIFLGKFLFINTTPDGELFGAGDPDELDLTMYIESANLSDKHAEIKFVDRCKYLLRDCNSETGTWTRVGHPGSVDEGLDLYQENRLRMYKVGEYQFVLQEHPTKIFNEVTHWLKANYFEQCIQLFEMKQIKTL